ncbi:MAG: apolipoprotein N-acyltransferase [Nitrospinaceae bacterium]
MKNLALKKSWPYLLSVFSGVLCVLIFPRFNFEPLAWFAFIPLLMAIEAKTPQNSALLGFIFGMVFYTCGLNWVNNTLINYGNLPSVVSFMVLGLLAAYLSFYTALFCYLISRVCKKNRGLLFLFAPVLWTSLEYIRSTHSELGFSWLGLGYSQFQTLPVIQMAEITGVYGISWLIMLVNIGLYIALKTWHAPDKMGVRFLSVTLLVFFCWWGYGSSALGRYSQTAEKTPAIVVGLIQGNIEQFMKWNPAYQKLVISKYRDLTLKAAQSKPQLIVWPETSLPLYYNQNPAGTQFVNDLARQIQTAILFGSPHKILKDGKSIQYNSAYLVSETGDMQNRYDKIHLVPFGEFVPFRKLLFFVEKMVDMIGDFGRGKKATLFEVAGHKVGVSICYELIFPDLIRQSVKHGAHFLVNITNDAWFGKSSASYQHMSMGVLRAVENRVPIVRAANTGVSGTIDANGTLRDETDLFVEVAQITQITPRQRTITFYTAYGDVFCWLCLFTTALLIVTAKNNRQTTGAD